MDYALERQNDKDKTRIIINKFNRSYTCGRGKENEIVCLSLLVSRRHCIFYRSTNNDLFVSDIGSSNGIFVNGMPQETFQMIKLRENDIIGIGCADDNPNNESLFNYKVCTFESSFVEEEETSILSKTVKNNDLPQRISAPPAKNNLGEKREHDTSADIHTAVPCKIQKCTDKNDRSSTVVSPKEINSNLSCDNQNPCCSNNNNTISFVETKSDIEVIKSDIEVKIDDDIEIIHTSLAKKVHLHDSEDYDVKCLRDIKSSSNRKNCKDNEKMDVCIIDEDIKEDKSNDNNSDRNNYNDSNKDENIIHTKEETSNIIDETNNLPSTSSTENPNFIHTNNGIIKIEEELQITDDEEILVTSNRKMTCSSPMKLRKVKNEPKTRFSEIDVVNLSDDEEGIFPYSQLFDTKFGDCKEEKVEVKQECANNDDENVEKISLLNMIEEIDLVNSDDEDNPWLERLSRSQLLTEDEDHDSKDVVVKTEIDLGIWEEDDILNAIMSEIPTCTSKVPDSENIPHESSTSVHNKIENAENDNANLLMAKVSKMDIDEAGPSGEPTLKNDDDIRSKRKIHTEQDTKLDKQTSMQDAKRTSMARKTVTSSKKLIPIIEPPNLPVKGNRANRNKDRIPKEREEKSLLNSPPEEEKMLKLKEKLNNNIYSKERKQRDSNRKEIPKSAADCHSLDELSLSKEQKKIIMEKRKIKLKELAEEKKKLSVGNNQNVKRRIAKPKAKVTLTNRGNFLTEQEPHESLSNKSATLPESSKQSKKQLTSKADILKESVISDIETQKPREENDISKHTVNDAATSLRQSLHLDNTVDIPVPKDSAHDSKATTSAEKRHSSRKETRKKNEIAIDPIANASELPDKSAERPSVSMQKENCSPKRVNSILKSKKKYRAIKKVTFSEQIEIRKYEIDPNNYLKKLIGKDAPIPMNKLIRKSNTKAEWCPKLEEFLLHIFKWSPIWLEEQRYLKTDPPLVPEHELQNMKLCYNSYKQYYEVVMPLLLIEIWCAMTKDIEMVEKNMQRVTAICSIIESSITRTPIPSTDLFLTTLMLEVLVRREDLNTTSHPTFGDLVFLEYVMNVRGKQVFYKVFAYVTHMHQTIITEFTHYNRDLRNYVKDPYAVVTYTLLTRPLEHNIPINRVQRIRTVVYLRSNMRMVQALQYLPQSPLLELILNPRVEDYQLSSVSTPPALVTKDNLNRKQLEAVFRVTDAVIKKEPKLCFIQGPPGTGKSKVIVNLVTQILYGDYKNSKALRILVCAPSNAAIDEIVIRLLNIRTILKPKRFNMVRIGRLESMHPTSKAISVTELAKRHLARITNRSLGNTSNNGEDMAILKARINSLQAELAYSQKMTERKIKEVKKKLFDVSTKYEILKSGKTMSEFDPKERAKFQRLSENIILAGADVIACTLSSCYTNQMESVFGGHREKISVCIVDEATQSCEAETIIPLILGVNTLVLVGDPNQLPATILSQQAKKLGLDQSLFSRIQNIFTSQSNNPIIMLDTQYRMDHAISYWPNKYFYGGRLKNAAEHNSRFPFYPYRVLDHNCVQNNDKFSNTTEAEFVANIIYTMMIFAKWENTDATISVGILSPYNNHRNLVLNKIREKIFSLPDNRKRKIVYEVNTVDGFQGQERDVIIMSCVRSHGIGFLSDKQRLCVALTRAKYSLILCGNFKTFMKDQMWYALITDARYRGVYNQVNAYAMPTVIKQFIVK